MIEKMINPASVVMVPHTYFIMAILLVLHPIDVSASCSNPHGENGYIRTDDNTTYTCDGTNWNTASENTFTATHCEY